MPNSSRTQTQGRAPFRVHIYHGSVAAEAGRLLRPAIHPTSAHRLHGVPNGRADRRPPADPCAGAVRPPRPIPGLPVCSLVGRAIARSLPVGHRNRGAAPAGSSRRCRRWPERRPSRTPELATARRRPAHRCCVAGQSERGAAGLGRRPRVGSRGAALAGPDRLGQPCHADHGIAAYQQRQLSLW